jgi:putative inorganic carbon (HCO3(-)) transporter
MGEALQVAGCIAATAAVSAAILASDRRLRAAGIVVSLAIAGGLLLGEGWDELEGVRERLALLAALSLAAIAAIAALARLFRSRPELLPLLLVAALPFRVPIEVGGEDANLLIPLYVVIAAGVVVFAIEALREGGARRGSEPRLLLIALAAAITLYALQSAYSEDIGFATRNVGFFLVPFAAMFVLLSEQRWAPRLLALSLAIVVAESLLFAVVGIGQAAVGEIFWNPALERSNDFHFYFRVNSLFWDPNIYGRYLALAAVLVVAVLAWTRDARRIGLLSGALLLLLVGLVFAFSQTSFVALLAGVAAVSALRWSLRWTAIATPLVAALVFAAVIFIGGTSESENDAREISSGRTTLIEGGFELARSEPLVGHGSASFSAAFIEQEQISPDKPAISHNEPITVAAEQGVVGILAYLALIAAALWALVGGMRRLAPGLGAPEGRVGDPAEGGPGALALARIALLAAFVALLIHTIGYAGYLTDPLTWALLAIGGSLAATARR